MPIRFWKSLLSSSFPKPVLISSLPVLIHLDSFLLSNVSKITCLPEEETYFGDFMYPSLTHWIIILAPVKSTESNTTKISTAPEMCSNALLHYLFSWLKTKNQVRFPHPNHVTCWESFKLSSWTIVTSALPNPMLMTFFLFFTNLLKMLHLAWAEWGFLFHAGDVTRCWVDSGPSIKPPPYQHVFLSLWFWN